MKEEAYRCRVYMEGLIHQGKVERGAYTSRECRERAKALKSIKSRV